ncbi:uncharacterized protein VTP21DRAFT_3784 [Calcarisporiella thermophila]|uniref:uncharacterized protein n=1 Tax=Calcarisporiella thermophila TaxID=911321 RepID=UPI003742C76C
MQEQMSFNLSTLAETSSAAVPSLDQQQQQQQPSPMQMSPVPQLYPQTSEDIAYQKIMEKLQAALRSFSHLLEPPNVPASPASQPPPKQTDDHSDPDNTVPKQKAALPQKSMSVFQRLSYLSTDGMISSSQQQNEKESNSGREQIRSRDPRVYLRARTPPPDEPRLERPVDLSRNILRLILDLNYFDHVSEQLNEQAKDANNTADALQTRIAQLEAELAALRHYQAAVEEEQAGIQRDRQYVGQLIHERKAVMEEVILQNGETQFPETPASMLQLIHDEAKMEEENIAYCHTFNFGDGCVRGGERAGACADMHICCFCQEEHPVYACDKVPLALAHRPSEALSPYSSQLQKLTFSMPKNSGWQPVATSGILSRLRAIHDRTIPLSQRLINQTLLEGLKDITAETANKLIRETLFKYGYNGIHLQPPPVDPSSEPKLNESNSKNVARNEAASTGSLEREKPPSRTEPVPPSATKTKTSKNEDPRPLPKAKPAEGNAPPPAKPPNDAKARAPTSERPPRPASSFKGEEKRPTRPERIPSYDRREKETRPHPPPHSRYDRYEGAAWKGQSASTASNTLYGRYRSRLEVRDSADIPPRYPRRFSEPRENGEKRAPPPRESRRLRDDSRERTREKRPENPPEKRMDTWLPQDRDWSLPRPRAPSRARTRSPSRSRSRSRSPSSDDNPRFKRLRAECDSPSRRSDE